MKFLKPAIVFLIINFATLGIGRWAMGNGANSDWYLGLNKAPWTPEGWVFGAAWTTVMLCFSIYMALLWIKRQTKDVLFLFLAQLVLNVSWNFLFFAKHWVDLALVDIIGLTVVLVIFMFRYRKELKSRNLLLAPYIIWLLIATSLNLYASIYN